MKNISIGQKVNHLKHGECKVLNITPKNINGFGRFNIILLSKIGTHAIDLDDKELF